MVITLSVTTFILHWHTPDDKQKHVHLRTSVKKCELDATCDTLETCHHKVIRYSGAQGGWAHRWRAMVYVYYLSTLTNRTFEAEWTGETKLNSLFKEWPTAKHNCKNALIISKFDEESILKSSAECIIVTPGGIRDIKPVFKEFSTIDKNGGEIEQNIYGETIVSEDLATSGVSGHIFTGERVRTFAKRLQIPRLDSLTTTSTCSEWAVVTTIHAPTKSIHKVLEQPDFCVIIVADRKTPIKEYSHLESERVHLLSVEKQENMQDMAITNILPWNHFGRKNLGYLYAIQHGAEVIFDFDDDNELISDIPFKTSEPWLVADETQVFNPYPMFVELEDVAWPRGFPLTQIQNVSTWQVPKFTTTNPSIGVVQSLANHDPDMDAIWRLTRKLPLNFDSNKRVVLSPGTYSSYNAQATIHYALWGTLLPVSVHGRVSDIWRSYIMQRLMHDVGQVVGFVSPFVKQVRNAHNYQGDYMSERPLYEKTEALIRVLSEWKGESAVFEERFVELFVELYERDFIEIKDVHLAQKWIHTLQQMGYEFPNIKTTELTIVKTTNYEHQCLAYYLCRGCPRASKFQQTRPANINACKNLRNSLHDANIADDNQFCVSDEFCDSPLQMALEKGAFEFPATTKRVWIDAGSDYTTFYSRCMWKHLQWSNGVTCEEFKKSKDIIGIALDANKKYFSILNKLERVLPVPTALGMKNSVVVFNHYTGPGCSSVNKPNLKAFDSLGSAAKPCTQIAKTEIVPMIRLDLIVNLIPPHLEIEFLKIDVQGKDLETAQSLGEKLTRVKKIYIEVQDEQFIPITLGQPGKSSVIRWFEVNGFSLNSKQSALENSKIGEWNLMFDNNVYVTHKQILESETGRSESEATNVWAPPTTYCYKKGNDWSECAGDHLLYRPSTHKQLMSRQFMCLKEPFCWLQLDWRNMDPPEWSCPVRKKLQFYDMSFHDSVMASAATTIEKNLNKISNASHEVFLCNCKHASSAKSNYHYAFKTCPKTPAGCHGGHHLNFKDYSNDGHFKKSDALIFGFDASMFEEWMDADKPLVLALWHIANQFKCTTKSSQQLFDKIRQLAFDKKFNHIIGGNTLYHTEYIRHYTGLSPLYLPATLISAVDGLTWTKQRNEFLWNSHEMPPSNPAIKLVKAGHEGRYELADLTKYAGVVVWPYSITNGKSVEQYAMNIPMFAPTAEFAKTLINDRTATYGPYCARLTSAMHPEKHKDSPYEFNPNVRIDTNGNSVEKDVKFWISFAEIYRWPCVRYFESFEELFSLLEKSDLDKMSACMRQANKWRHFEELQNWCWVTEQIQRDPLQDR